MKGIKYCDECTYYSLKTHKCTAGAKDTGEAKDPFYKDCKFPDVVPTAELVQLRDDLYETDAYTGSFDEAVKRLEDFPATDVAPVRHGRWDDDHKCTVCKTQALCEEKPDPYACGLLTLFYVDSAYCPNCESKMDGDEE